MCASNVLHVHADSQADNTSLSSIWQMPTAIDLERSRLQLSSRLAALKQSEQVYPGLTGMQAHAVNTSKAGGDVNTRRNPNSSTFK